MKHSKTPAQVILHWHVQQGNIFNARIRVPAHIMDNLSVFDFQLDNKDVMTLSYLNHPMSKICPDPRLIL
jgi:diketogulonate reductase-like aldo/keto reductase